MKETEQTSETDVLTALRRILRATDLDAKALARQTGLTTSQLLVLELLSLAGELTVGGIADRVGLTQGTVTSLIDKLQARELVSRRRGSADRRQVKVSLTEEGRELLGQAPTALQTRFLAEFSTLRDWERYAIISALQRVADLMGAEKLDASPVLDVGQIGETPGSD
ncbi:MAG: MarR family transcriptional regulator [Gammaproteobacteria bacterium]